MSVSSKDSVQAPDFTPPLPLPVPETKVVTEPPKKVSLDLSSQHVKPTKPHLKLSDSGGLFPNTSAATGIPYHGTQPSAGTGPILKRRNPSERILEPHVVHIRKTETGKKIFKHNKVKKNLLLVFSSLY